MEKKNFLAFTNLPALKKNAIQLCGQEFINSLTTKSIYAKNEEFWRLVNEKLNIPDNAYEVRQAREQEEKEQKLAAEKAEDKAKQERLLANKKELYSKIRQGWKITVYEFTEVDKYGNKFVAQCTKESELEITTWFSKTANDAYSKACNLVDETESYKNQLTISMEHYKVLKPLYLMLIYLSGCDIYNPYRASFKNKNCKENFEGLSMWNGFDFDIINSLNQEGLIELSTTKKTLNMTIKGMEQARNILVKINLDGVEILLEQREHHEEYINYQKELDIFQEEEDEFPQDEE